MTTYSIFFINNYSTGNNTQDYAFFQDVPNVTTSTGGVKVYSNVFLSTTLASGANWNIDITKNYYAWCGTASQALATGVKVSVGMGKLATLGAASAPGSTFTVRNVAGNPVFDSNVTYTSAAGCFEVDTGTDFTPNMGWVVGLGGSDDAGRMKPLATIAAPGNAITSIAPVTKFYICAYSASQGTVIDTSSITRNVNPIDFTANPGMFAATVSQEATGAFTVKYFSHASFALTSPGPVAQLQQLKRQVQTMQMTLSSALEELSSEDNVALAVPTFRCTVSWQNNPTPMQSAEIARDMQAYMTAQGYQIVSTVFVPDLVATYSRNGGNLQQATQDWTAARMNLAANLRAMTQNNPNVTQVPGAAAITDAEATVSKDVAPDHPSKLGPDTAAPATNGIANGVEEHETIEAKKRRAMKMLEDAGLAGLA